MAHTPDIDAMAQQEETQRLETEGEYARLREVNADLLAALKWIDTYLANQPLDQQAKFLIIEKVKDALAKAKGQLGT